MSNKFKRKLNRKREKKKKKIKSLEEKRVEKILEEIKNHGLINYEKNGEKINIEINAKAALDFLHSLHDIPFPIHLYNELKNNSKTDEDFYGQLKLLLALSMKEYEEVGFDVYKMKGKTKMEDDELSTRYNMIDFYDLKNPYKLDDNFYMFTVDKEIISAYTNIAKNQNPRDFARYYLK